MVIEINNFSKELKIKKNIYCFKLYYGIQQHFASVRTGTIRVRKPFFKNFISTKKGGNVLKH